MSEELPRNPDGTFRAVDAAPPEPPQIDTFRLQLLRQAEELGLTFDEVKAFDNGTLNAMLNTLMRQKIAHQKEIMTQRTLEQHEVKAPPPPLDFGINPDTGRPFTEADFAPSIVNAFRAQNAQITSLKQRLEQQDQAAQQRAFIDATALLDDIFDDLPPELKRYVGGNATMQQLHEARSPAAQIRLSAMARANVTVQSINQSNFRRSRNAIMQAVREIAQAFNPQQANQPPNPYDQPATAPQNYPPRQPQGNGAFPQAPIPQEQWDEASLAAPTYRPSPQMPQGDARAIENIERKQRAERGAVGRLTDDQILATLLPQQQPQNGQPPRRG
jgi:hypothetical protein